MQFLNPWLALGLLAVSIPIIIHILTRQTGKTVDWGAILFLRDSLVIRNRRIRLEEALLMAARCLLLALLAMALARPFIPPGSNTPWFAVLPLFFIGAVSLGIGVVLWDLVKWRWILLIGGIAALLLCAALVWFEKVFNLSRFSKGGRQDIALIVDASTSMALRYDGQSNFQRAIEEVRTIVKRSPRGNSFSLILGGPTPSARILTPTSDREFLLQQLEDVRPLEGEMAAYDCLTLASLGLAQGSNPAKQIVVITDGQNVGWETNKPARWAFLKDAFENLPSTPQVIVREMPLPSNFRNVSLADISFSRDIVGVDRPVKISVTVENTGTEAVSPRQVELEVDGRKLVDETLGQMMPGTKETLYFTHQFEAPGAHEVRSQVFVDDEIEQDNTSTSALNIVRKLRVLLVDGNAGGRFFDRATSFAALALAPGTTITAPGSDPDGEEAMRFLVDPEVVSAIDLTQMPALGQYDTVILADVPRMPREVTENLESFVNQGGGLLIAAGQRASSEFYNSWVSQDGLPVMPAKLIEPVVPNPNKDPITASLETFRHPSVRVVANRRESDLETGSFAHYWRLKENTGVDAIVGGRLNNGDPYITARKIGLGNLVLLGSSLDLRSGNLPSRQAFVPFIHELVYFLANPGNFDLNLAPKWELVLHLAGNEHAFSGHGLRGEYFASRGDREPKVTRIDPAIQFNWRGGSPASGIPQDNFKIRWTGRIQAPRSAKYKFRAEADDYLTVYIDGRDVLRAEYGRSHRMRDVWLDANRLHDIRIEYQEDKSNAQAILYWESRDLQRQIVPTSAFRSVTGKEEDVIATYRVTGPAGEKRIAKIEATAGGAVAKIQGDVAAGTYQIHVPDDQREKFNELLGDERDTIPFTVKRDPAESRLQPLTNPDKEFLANYIGLVQPQTPEDVIQILNGKSFGEELWKYLALAALFFLLLEVALSRWIATSRQMAQDQRIKFDATEAPGDGFEKQLKQVKKNSVAAA
ncbi:MAG: PA14 domain-containing protein [Verrucomicrobiota bacterium]